MKSNVRSKSNVKSKFFKLNLNKTFEEDENEDEKKERNVRKMYRLKTDTKFTENISDYDIDTPKLFATNYTFDTTSLATKRLSGKIKQDVGDSDDDGYSQVFVHESVGRKFNCLGWVLTNVTSIRGNIQQANVIDCTGDVNNKVEYLSEVLQNKLKNEFYCDVQKFEENDLKIYQKKVDKDPLHSKFIIVMAVGGGAIEENNLAWANEDYDYHFVKYFNGQWSQKIGTGNLLVSKSGEFPKNTWFLHQCYDQLEHHEYQVSLYRLKEIVVRLKTKENLFEKFSCQLNLKSISYKINNIMRKLKLYAFDLNEGKASCKYIDDEQNIYELICTKDYSFFPNVFPNKEISINTIIPSSSSESVCVRINGKCKQEQNMIDISGSGTIKDVMVMSSGGKFNILNVDIIDIKAGRENLMPVVKIESYHSKKIFLLVDPIGKKRRPKLLKELGEVPYKYRSQLIENFKKSMNKKFEL